MGFIHAEIDLSNPRNRDLTSLKVNALVDTGAITLCIPEHVAVQLELAELEKREVTTPEGRHVRGNREWGEEKSVDEMMLRPIF